MNRRTLISIVALFVLGTFSLFRFFRTEVPHIPVARAMPPVVSQDMGTILQSLEDEIKKATPGIVASLLPGLSAQELEAVEADLGFPLHPEMRQLYQWHNGAARGVGFFPGYEFYSLQEAIQLNKDLNAQYKKSGAWALMAHEANWLTLFPDGAGDGYYYDHRRGYARGGVFFNFRESGYYIYYPSIKNLLQAITDCYRQGVYRGGETTDFKKEQQILESFGQPIAQ